MKTLLIKKVTQELMKLSRADANSLLLKAATLMVSEPSLRLAQAIISVAEEGVLETPWPELFHTECPIEATRLLYGITENGGRRVFESKGLFGGSRFKPS